MIFNRIPLWALALLSGILSGIPFAILSCGFLIYFFLIPLLHIWLTQNFKTSLAMTYMAAITCHTIAFYWIGLNQGTTFWIALLSLIAAVFYLSLFWLIPASIVHFFQIKKNNGLILFPFAWITMEFLRSFGAMGFPWGQLALTQVFSLPLIQMVDSTGDAGIAFFICVVNALLYLGFIEKNYKKYGLAAISVWLIVFFFGVWRINFVENHSHQSDLTVAIIQPNVNPVEKWDTAYKETLYRLMDSLTIAAMKLEPDLVLWPEAALPTNLRLSSKGQIYQNLVDKSKIPILAGTVDYIYNDEGRIYYNGSILLQPGQGSKIYHKLQLVPFAEYIPFSGQFPVLKKLNFGQGNFVQGKDYTLFNIDGQTIGNMICYESSFPRIAKQFVKQGAGILSIQTNDAWSGNSPGAYQHFAIAQLRAVENRIPVIRCANTGISGIISPTGKAEQKLSFNEQGIILGSLLTLNSAVLYPSGDIFSLFCILLSIGIMIREWFRKE